MELQHEDFNFNDPLELKEVFKVTKASGDLVEHCAMIAIGWEDVRGIYQYPYEDEWKKFPGEKFYISISGQHQDRLILGSYDMALRYWRNMRNDYPVFAHYEEGSD